MLEKLHKRCSTRWYSRFTLWKSPSWMMLLFYTKCTTSKPNLLKIHKHESISRRLCARCTLYALDRTVLCTLYSVQLYTGFDQLATYIHITAWACICITFLSPRDIWTAGMKYTHMVGMMSVCMSRVVCTLIIAVSCENSSMLSPKLLSCFSNSWKWSIICTNTWTGTAPKTQLTQAVGYVKEENFNLPNGIYICISKLSAQILRGNCSISVKSMVLMFNSISFVNSTGYFVFKESFDYYLTF